MDPGTRRAGAGGRLVLRRKIFSRASGVGHGTDADLETES
ncbi:hypothetical protein I551_8811 [Mycobacterium ulcerans str. Harvey]|uniref:Uncharacterized protein n=1 Tax=Mycobacterium ulcerans str. Harvey TaxID=1299332 RepID=A0ABN0R9Z3_MYCUL|nr:hypothetical protein I551_8811 [Mycobacterium ulcerans str. Harvey]